MINHNKDKDKEETGSTTKSSWGEVISGLRQEDYLGVGPTEETAIDFIGILKKVNALEDKTIDLEKKTNELEETAKRTEKLIEESKEGQDRTNTFMMWMAGIVVGVFFITGFIMIIDYFKYNIERYEKFIDKTEEIKESFYTNKNKLDEVEEDLINLKSCFKKGGWNRCLQ